MEKCRVVENPDKPMTYDLSKREFDNETWVVK